MSFPNIPDVDPYINLTFEDAINLLLASIAMEEVSLSKLLDAETKKVLCVLENCKYDDFGQERCNCNDAILHDAIEINKSVDDTIKNIIKLQMLLQFKLENIIELLPCTSATTSASTSTTTTCTRTTTTNTSSSTTAQTTTCTTSTCSTTTKKECCYGLIGTGKGCVPNCCDKFNNFMAKLYAVVYCRDIKNRTIHYCVGNDETNLRMCASGHQVKIHCPDQCTEKLVIFGKGYAEKQGSCPPNTMGKANYILTVGHKIPGVLEFRMEINSDANPALNHDSGFVQVKCAISNLQIIDCC